MQVIKLASSTEFTTKIRKVSNFCTEVIHFKLEALEHERINCLENAMIDSAAKSIV